MWIYHQAPYTAPTDALLIEQVIDPNPSTPHPPTHPNTPPNPPPQRTSHFASSLTPSQPLPAPPPLLNRSPRMNSSCRSRRSAMPTCSNSSAASCNEIQHGASSRRTATSRNYTPQLRRSPLLPPTPTPSSRCHTPCPLQAVQASRSAEGLLPHGQRDGANGSTASDDRVDADADWHPKNCERIARRSEFQVEMALS